ncbi:putative ankyrin repeat protein [Cotonvirus japonicus]|uniref:Ankyrin repeat protein n=1 Tax=Cotonvirus japonicus TaxID=2811091 RepID=A0ABM7NTR5_9VIRU|nr:putative ankyrin repeat protein [Cotonvirus japonicus]BCS83560.1 putative ankyrin repeat protein [Cotonvirus japonicus]
MHKFNHCCKNNKKIYIHKQQTLKDHKYRSKKNKKITSIIADTSNETFLKSVPICDLWSKLCKISNDLPCISPINFYKFLPYKYDKTPIRNIFSEKYLDIYTNTCLRGKPLDLFKFNISDVHERDDDIMTHLMYACKYSKYDSNFKIIKYLLVGGVSVDIINYSNHTALMYALELPGNIKIIKLLLRYGADVNILDYYNINPLLSWSKTKYSPDIKIAKLLLQAGADINVENCLGMNTLTCLLHYCNENIFYQVKFLLESGIKIKPLSFIRAKRVFEINEDISVIALLLDYGYDYKNFTHTLNSVKHQPIIRIIETIEYCKSNLKTIQNDIHERYHELTFQPGSIKFKIIQSNWYLNNQNIKDCSLLKDSDFLNYFGIYDLDSFSDKISENFKLIE